MSVGSMWDSWLTKAVEHCREIWRVRPNRERKLEIDCIVAAIRQDKARGGTFLSQGVEALQHAIDKGLDKAARADSNTASGRPTPAQECVVKICEELGVAIPGPNEQ